MKELSIKDKARRYDEALERAKGAHNSAKSDKENGVTDKITEYTIQLAETIFPELKVSDDERIRKSLIELFHDTVSNDEIFSDYGLDKTEVLAWLEKQGKETSWKPSKEEMDALYGIEDDVRRRSTIQVLEYARSLDTYNQYGKADIDKNIAWLEKQSNKSQGKSVLEAIKEEKIDNTDRVEPKFMVGDWVVTSYGKVNQVISVDEDGYGYTLDDDTYFSDSWCDKYHLWTIDDAREGDVLVASDKSIFIYDGSINENGNVGFHIALTKDMSVVLNSDDGCGGEEKDSCYPATKEQRDLLFQKMKEAGYEWNEDKKELIKL